MTLPNKKILEQIPPASEIRSRLGSALAEVEILRKLLPIAQRADEYRDAQGAALSLTPRRGGGQCA